MPNLVLQKKKDLSTFRRIALGTWRTVGDPSVYGSMTLPMDETMRYIDTFRRVKGKRLTISHMMALAVAKALEKMPDANAVLRWGRIYLRKDIGVFFQVATEDEKGDLDLSGTTIHGANEKSLEQIVDEFEDRVNQVRTGQDKELEGTRKSFQAIPVILIGLVLKLISFLTVTLNLNLKFLGIPKDPFGSVMITNVGSLGLEEAYVPLVPYSRVPLLIALGAVKEQPVVVDGKIEIRKQIRLFSTFDHRILDGSHAAIFSKTLRAWFEQPFDHFDPLEKA